MREVIFGNTYTDLLKIFVQSKRSWLILLIIILSPVVYVSTFVNSTRFQSFENILTLLIFYGLFFNITQFVFLQQGGYLVYITIICILIILDQKYYSFEEFMSVNIAYITLSLTQFLIFIVISPNSGDFGIAWLSLSFYGFVVFLPAFFSISSFSST